MFFNMQRKHTMKNKECTLVGEDIILPHGTVLVLHSTDVENYRTPLAPPLGELAARQCRLRGFHPPVLCISNVLRHPLRQPVRLPRHYGMIALGNHGYSGFTAQSTTKGEARRRRTCYVFAGKYSVLWCRDAGRMISSPTFRRYIPGFPLHATKTHHPFCISGIS